MTVRRIVGTGLALACVGASADATRTDDHGIALVGVTIVDVTHEGHAHRDRTGMVVLVRGGLIEAVEPSNRARMGPNVERINAKGRFLVPGLIDGYGAVRNHHFADAYLFEGVTTVVVPIVTNTATVDGENAVERDTDGPAVETALAIDARVATSPLSPARALSRQEMQNAVQAARLAGHRAIVLGPEVAKDQFKAAAEEAHRLGMGVEAQLAATPYRDAAVSGADVFVRNDKYSMALSSETAFTAYASQPNGPGGSLARREICFAPEVNRRIVGFARLTRRSKTAFMPVLTMENTADALQGSNPWTTPAAAFVTPVELDDPVDPATGDRPYLRQHPDQRQRIQTCARRKQDIDRQLHASGAVHVVGSSTPGFGVMPGGGVHDELSLMTDIGLTPREALAAATSVPASLFRLRDRGLVAPGLRADLILLRSDPRESIKALDDIDLVVANGKWIDRDELLREARERRLSEHPVMQAHGH